MERLTIIVDNGLDEIYFVVPSDREGAYTILDIAKYSDEEEKENILINIADKLKAYEETGLEPEEVAKMQKEIDRLRNALKEKCDYISKISSQIHVEAGF